MNTPRIRLKLESTPSQVTAWFRQHHGGKYSKYKRYFLNLSGAEILSLTPQQIGCRLGNTPADFARGEFLYAILHKGYRSSAPKMHHIPRKGPKKQRMIMEKLEPMCNDEDSDYCIKFLATYKIWFDWPAVQLHYGISTTEAHFVRNLRTNYGWVKSCRCRSCVECGTHKRGYWYHPDIHDGSAKSIGTLLPRKVMRPKNRPKQHPPLRKRTRTRKRLRNYDDTLDWQPSDEALSPPTRPLTRLQKRRSDEQQMMKSPLPPHCADFPDLVPSRSVSRSGSRGRHSPSSDSGGELVLPMLPPMPSSLPLHFPLPPLGGLGPAPPLPFRGLPMPMPGKLPRTMVPVMRTGCVKTEHGPIPLPLLPSNLHKVTLGGGNLDLPIKMEPEEQDRLSLQGEHSYLPPIKVEVPKGNWTFPSEAPSPKGGTVPIKADVASHNALQPGAIPSFFDSPAPALTASKQRRAINLPQAKRRRLNPQHNVAGGDQLSLMVPQLPSLRRESYSEKASLFVIKPDDVSPISLPKLPELPNFAELLEAPVSSPRVEDNSHGDLLDINSGLSPLFTNSERCFSFDECQYPLMNAPYGQDLFPQLL